MTLIHRKQPGPNSVSLTECRQNFSTFVDRVVAGETIRVSVSGHDTLVMLNVDEYDRLLASDQLLTERTQPEEQRMQTQNPIFRMPRDEREKAEMLDALESMIEAKAKRLEELEATAKGGDSQADASKLEMARRYNEHRNLPVTLRESGNATLLSEQRKHDLLTEQAHTRSRAAADQLEQVRDELYELQAQRYRVMYPNFEPPPRRKR